MNRQRTLLSILQSVEFSATISEIADRLYLSQPYVSRILKDEETKFGVVLINRRDKPIELTKFGVFILNSLKKIASAEDSLNTGIENLKAQQSRPIRISNGNPFLTEDLIDAITRYLDAHPQANIELTQTQTRHVASDLAEGAIDITIGQRWNAADIEITDLPSPVFYLPIADSCQPFDPSTLYLPLEDDTLTRMAECRYVGLSGHSEFQAYVDNLFKRVGIHPRNQLFLPTPASALKTVFNMTNATTITTRKLAERHLPAGRYNLMPLPTNFIRTDTSIMTLTTADSTIQQLAHFLTDELVRAIR